jgi:hypothetical protein
MRIRPSFSGDFLARDLIDGRCISGASGDDRSWGPGCDARCYALISIRLFGASADTFVDAEDRTMAQAVAVYLEKMETNADTFNGT